MSDFMQVLNQVGTIAGQVATVVGQVTGQTPTINPGAPMPPYYPQPGPMAQDRIQWSPGAYPGMAGSYPAQNAPVLPVQTPPPAPGGFMQVMSALFSKIASFFKQLFGGGGQAPVGTVPVGTAPVPAVPMADAREQLFSMFPTGQGTVLGFVPVSVTRYADRLIASAGSFGQAAIVKYQGEYLFYENNKQPVKVASAVSSRTPSGDMHFDLTLENGKKVGADILADGRTIRYDRYTLSLR